MPPLLIRFALDLRDPADHSPLGLHGPLFHRWLPDGEADAISLHTGHPDFELRMWFERLGFVQNGFIEFSYDRREVEPTIMASQGQLEAGPLRGQLEVRQCPEAAHRAMTAEEKGNADYARFAKTLIQDILAPPLRRLFSVLGIAYGQYWLPEFEQWDSRAASLGGYCQRLNMKWARDPSSAWLPFLPDEPVHMASIVVLSSERPYRELLTKQDWFQLPQMVRTSSDPSAAEVVMRRAHELLQRGDIRFALVEASTALELAIEQFVRHKQASSAAIQDLFKPFSALPLASKMGAIVMSIGGLPADTIEGAAAAIEQRHRLVHDGRPPTASARRELECLLIVIASLLPRPFYKFPIGHHANTITTPEKWNELYQQHHLPPLDEGGG